MRDPVDDARGRDCPVEALASAWSSYPPVPGLAAFITDDVRADEACVLSLVRLDAQQRVHRGESVRLEHYAKAISPEMFAPGRELTQLVLGFERLAGTSAENMRERLDDGYRWDIEAAFCDDELAPPDDADAPPDDSTVTVGIWESSGSPRRWAKGDRIGRFKLRASLGSGGFGEVWLASRQRPRLEAAIKVLKPGRADEENIKRFEAEAQALAFLEHRYVAKILDAGTARGLPYIAMQYVDGKPLTKYCDDHRFSLAQRLELMAHICEGVQHAHQRGLIHRDLKPDNILVTEVTKHSKDLDDHESRLVVARQNGQVTVAVPKIVDFGLAKAAEKTIRLADGTLTVDLGKMMGTPEYMAPEQAGHHPLEVTQRADIFALGVILYELLTGTLPLSREDLRKLAPGSVIDELVRVLRETPRPDPSTRFSKLDAETLHRVSQRREIGPTELGRRLRGRVRHLCGKALRLEPEKRFSAAAVMALDIRNYLNGDNFIEAAAEPWRDRVGRNVRKHSVGYGALAAAIIAIGLGMWAFQQRSRAAEAHRTAIWFTDVMIGLNDEIHRGVDIDTSFEHAAEAAAFHGASPRMLGLVYRSGYRIHLEDGRPDTAEKMLLKAIAYFDQGDPWNAALARIDLTNVYFRNRRGDDAERVSVEAIDLMTRLGRQDDPAFIDAEESLASSWKWQGRTRHSPEMLEKAVTEYDRLIQKRVDARHDALAIAGTQYNLALALVSLDRLEEADQYMSEALNTRVREHGIANEKTINAYAEHARIKSKLKKPEQAEQLYREALAAAEEYLDHGHWRTIRTQFNLGRLLVKRDHAEKVAEGLELMQSAYDLQVATAGAFSPGTLGTARRLIEDLIRFNHEAEAERVAKPLVSAQAPLDLSSEATEELDKITLLNHGLND